MITVHHLENSRSQRVLWLLEELGLAYEVKRYARDPKTMLAPPELAAVHPLGKSPVITDGKVTVAESGAIVEYLLDTYGQVRTAPVPFFIKPVVKAIADKVTKSFIAPNLERQFDFMEAELAKRPWFAGAKFSAADIQMSFPIEAAAARAGLDASRPRLMDWLERIHARPAYQRALEVGGPYGMAD